MKNRNKFEKRIICFDFDGTCTKIDTYPTVDNDNINVDVKNCINYFFDLGFEIVINSSRQSIFYDSIKNFLDASGIKYSHIQLGSKPVADLYIDDKGLLAENLIEYICDWFGINIYDPVCNGEFPSRLVENIHNVPENPNFKETNTKNFRIALPITGGLDSTTIWKMLVNAGKDYLPFYVDFGQEYKQQELDTIKSISDELFDKLIVLDLSTVKYKQYKHILTGRNFAVVWAISNYFLEHNFWGEIWFGNLSGETPIQDGDKSSRFFNDVQKLINSTVRDVRIINPLQGLIKSDLISYWESYKSKDFFKTRSCFSSGTKECGHCQSCFRKYVAFKFKGYDISDTFEFVDFSPYIEKYKIAMTSALASRDFSKYSKNRIHKTLTVIKGL